MSQYSENNGVKKLLLFILILFFFYLLFNYIYKQQKKLPEKISKLEIRGHNVLTKDNILDLIEMKPGVSFKGLEYAQLEEKLKRHPEVQDAQITRKTQDQLLVTITEKKTEFIVNTNNSLYEIDQDFNLLSKDDVKERDVCIISGSFRIESNKIVGVKFKDLVESVRDAFRMFPELQNRISEIVLNPDGEIVMYIYAPQKIKVHLGNGFPSKQARKLYATLAYFENKNISADILDLRGDDAVYH